MAKNLQSDYLSTFLTCILSVDSSSKSPVRVQSLNLLSLLANNHHASLSTHLPKILPFLLRRLRDSDSAVRTACISAASALSPIGFSSLFSSLLGAVLSEQDGNAQIGSCLCLKAAVDAASVVVVSDEAELRRVLPKMVKMVRGDGFKAKAALLGLIASVVAVNEGGVVNGRGGLVGSVVGCAVEMLSCEDWAARKAAAEVLETVALAAGRESATEFKRFCVSSLDSRRFDKVKITRETMNRALEAWRELPGGPAEDLLFSRSNSSFSKGGVSPSVSRRSSFAGVETPKPKKTMAKTRSSLSDGLMSCASPSISSSTSHIVGLETPQRKKTISKSRSSLSDDSTITDSSSVSKSSHDVGFETLQSKKPISKSRSSLPNDLAATPKKKTSTPRSSDGKLSTWKVEIAKAESEDDAQSKCKSAEVDTAEERVQEFVGFRSGCLVASYLEEDESEGLVLGGRGSEEVGESNADVEDISLIREQLLQIERQQSNLLDLLQRFMGNSQNGIDSLETRVTGLERALDEISYDLAVQSGRIPKNDSAGSTCCPSTEFLSPKFWRKTEGRSSAAKTTYSGGVPNKGDSNLETVQGDGHWFQEQNEGAMKAMKSISQSVHRGRTCSPRSLDVASSATFITPVVKGV